MTPVSLLNLPMKSAFTEEQLIKITHRKHYVKKQKRDTTTSKDDELDLLGDEDVDSFTGSHADLESAADNLFTSLPRPQPLPFSSLSIKTPAKTVPPTHPPQELPYSRRLNQIWKNPWVTHLTSIYSRKWGPSRHLC